MSIAETCDIGEFSLLKARYVLLMWLFRLPGVYEPQEDTWLLLETLRSPSVRVGVRVLDIGTGTGVLAVAAARGGAGQVTAIDVCGRAVFAARVNGWLRRLPIRVLRGSLLEAVGAFDVIVANPPYVCSDDPPGTGRRDRTWNGGPGGRAMLDLLCSMAPSLLAPGGMILIVQSALCGVQNTLELLCSEGLHVAVIARRREPFGPVMRAKASQLESRGLICPGQRYEELVVIRADRVEQQESHRG
ncbi:MAG: HemK2/MTQ2 family protein methyltransferase [Actinomadura sp.]